MRKLVQDSVRGTGRRWIIRSESPAAAQGRLSGSLPLTEAGIVAASSNDVHDDGRMLFRQP
jgi:hypothetical protein